ncbi:hypothetical protein F511_32938 [Dorcoceras hygrometricum]|uniref:Uncharacterized protein n=1 Tax=Dorcoceras hygrometricum TaxID=472368 RepID=A0A2Z7BVR4_9LAMI|nr:hypothetical protein F511_32938 [Dorcoceras hygrometricum]
MFTKKEYEVWKIRMQAHLAEQDDDMWFVITDEPMKNEDEHSYDYNCAATSFDLVQLLVLDQQMRAVEKRPVEKEAETKKKKEKDVVVVKKLVVLGAAKKDAPASKRKPVVDSSDSESIVSLPLVQIKKKQRTQRTNPVKKIAADRGESNSGPDPEIPTEAENVSTSAAPEENTQAGDKEDSSVVKSAADQPVQQSLTTAGKGIFPPMEIREINWVTDFLPKIDPALKGKWILEAYAFPDPVELHCLLVLNSAYEDVSSKMAEYDKWACFRIEIKTKFVSDLLERRMLVLYMEVKKRVEEHRANFNPAEPSANYDHMCIRFLDRELKVLAMQNGALRLQADLPLLIPESSVAGSTPDDLLLITCNMGCITSTQGTTPSQETEKNRLRKRRRSRLRKSVVLLKLWRRQRQRRSIRLQSIELRKRSVRVREMSTRLMRNRLPKNQLSGKIGTRKWIDQIEIKTDYNALVIEPDQSRAKLVEDKPAQGILVTLVEDKPAQKFN